MEAVLVQGERLLVLERMIVAPAVGVFRPLEPEIVTCEGEFVEKDQAIGVLEGPGMEIVVRSPFRGFLMGMLAEPGQRLREGQPVAWLRVA